MGIVSFLRPVRGRLILGCALLVVVLIGAADAALHPTGNALDRMGYELVPDQWAQPFWHHVTDLGDPAVVAAGVLLAVAWVIRSDRRRAVTCVVAPLTAILLCEIVIKPMVGRRLGGIYSYPSGHVTAAAAMLADLVFATPSRWRWLTGSLAAGGAGLVAFAVIADRQHYPSDAIAALTLVPAVLILIDSVNRPGLLAALMSSNQAWIRRE